jgi:hypothetical protein
MDMEWYGHGQTRFFVSVRTETNRNSMCFGSVLVFFAVCFETNQNKNSVFRNKPKLKINTFLCNGHGRGHGQGYFSIVSVCFGWSFGVSVISKNRNKRLVSDSVETSFGSSFGYIETKLVS